MSPLVRAASLSNFAEVARQSGLDPERLLRQAGLDPVCLSDPDLRISAAAVLQLLELSAAQARNASFGLLMAESRRLSDFGAISLLFRHQATLQSALAVVMQHREQLNDALEVRLDNDGQQVVLREEFRKLESQPAAQAIELALGVMVRLLRAQLGYQWVPTAVRFRHAAPANLSVHRRVFGLEPQFGSAYDGIEFPVGDLDRANPGADPAMLRYAQQLVDAQAPAKQDSLASEVRDSLRHLLPGGRSSIGQVAQTLGYTARTLQRRLDAQGHSYSMLLEQVRRERVLYYLDDSRYSLEQISALLGFSAPSVFSRWFREQFGQAPRAWRSAGRSRGTPGRA